MGKERYSEAARRHFVDSEQLATASRWGNAGHLVGFAGECAIKHNIETLTSVDIPHGHFPDIASIALKHLRGRRGTAMRLVLKLPELMNGWDIALRYASDVAVNQTKYKLWRTHAGRLLGAAGISR